MKLLPILIISLILSACSNNTFSYPEGAQVKPVVENREVVVSFGQERVKITDTQGKIYEIDSSPSRRYIAAKKIISFYAGQGDKGLLGREPSNQADYSIIILDLKMRKQLNELKAPSGHTFPGAWDDQEAYVFYKGGYNEVLATYRYDPKTNQVTEVHGPDGLPWQLKSESFTYPENAQVSADLENGDIIVKFGSSKVKVTDTKGKIARIDSSPSNQYIAASQIISYHQSYADDGGESGLEPDYVIVILDLKARKHLATLKTPGGYTGGGQWKEDNTYIFYQNDSHSVWATYQYNPETGQVQQVP